MKKNSQMIFALVTKATERVRFRGLFYFANNSDLLKYNSGLRFTTICRKAAHYTNVIMALLLSFRFTHGSNFHTVYTFSYKQKQP